MTFDNLYASINNGPLIKVQIVHYRHGNFIHIFNYETPGIGVAVLLDIATINSNTVNQVLIENNNQNARILFNTPEERLFFLNEIQRYICINNYYINA